jgi:hypothetical protein
VRRPERLTRILLRALRFDGGGHDALEQVGEDEWDAVLAIADEARLTLPLGVRCEELLPERVRGRIRRNAADNAWRFENSVTAHREIIKAFDRRGVPFLVLKGLTHFPFFCDDLRLRQQYDIDLYCPAAFLEAARGALEEIGYEPVLRSSQPRTDHLPTMVRKTGWRWRGDYHDPAMPLNVELHFRFWDSAMEGFPAAGAERFWGRRVLRAVGPLEIPALAWEDTVRYAAWHITRHLLRGDLRGIHLYEFARLLEATADDDAFWLTYNWATADAIAARMAVACFGCRMHSSARAALDGLPSRVEKWFERFALSPLLGAARPNKDELLLHLLLAPAARDRARIFARRLAPSLPPPRVHDPHAAGAAPRKTEWLFLLRRAWFHLRAFAPLACNALRR